MPSWPMTHLRRMHAMNSGSRKLPRRPVPGRDGIRLIVRLEACLLSSSRFSCRHVILSAIAGVAVVTLGIFNAAGARAGGAPILPGILRVVTWGAIAMAVIAGARHLFNVTVG